MSDELYIFTAVLIAGTCIVIFGMRALASFQGARLRESRENVYRDLAAKAVAVQGDAATRLASVQAELSGVAMRLTAIETMLKSVE